MPVDRRKVLGLLAASVGTPLFTSTALAQGFAGLGQDVEGFALPQPNPTFQFPRDHGPHPDFRIEWWYVTANLRTPDGADMGIQWTLFRSGLAPEAGTGWATPQVWFAHGAMTRPDAHMVAERAARGGIGQAGVTISPFAAWVDDWQMVGHPGTGDALDDLTLSARGEDWRYDLRLIADKPLILNGDKGYSLKHERGQASYYYSQPHYSAEGVLTWPDGPVEVTGTAWLDREWSSQPLDSDQTGWDWFSLHLDGDIRLMVYRLRDADGGGYTPGTWINAKGHAEPIADGAIRLTPLAQTDVDGRRIPTSWRIELPSRGVDLTTTAVNPMAWMGTRIAYWEGPVRVTGTHAGRGYLEMTGYD